MDKSITRVISGTQSSLVSGSPSACVWQPMARLYPSTLTSTTIMYSYIKSIFSKSEKVSKNRFRFVWSIGESAETRDPIESTVSSQEMIGSNASIFCLAHNKRFSLRNWTSVSLAVFDPKQIISVFSYMSDNRSMASIDTKIVD